jgi:two-component system phosphate regulon response regulator PhoB
MKWTMVYFDDQRENIESLALLLQERFKVIGCLNAPEYASILNNYNPHLLLLDVHMPILDGHALYQKISEHPSYNGCPVVFISGDESDENKFKSYAEGGVDFLTRDLRPEEVELRLANKIRFYVDRLTNLELGNLHLDLKTMHAMINNKNLDLTLLEFRILGHILRALPNRLTRLDLIKKIWGHDSVKPGTINTHLTNLKPKLESWNYQIKVRDESILLVDRKNQ